MSNAINEFILWTWYSLLFSSFDLSNTIYYSDMKVQHPKVSSSMLDMTNDIPFFYADQYEPVGE